MKNKNISEQVERSNILQYSLLARFQNSDDIPPCKIPRKSRIKYLKKLTEIEVCLCINRSGKVYHSLDDISMELMTACCDSIEP